MGKSRRYRDLLRQLDAKPIESNERPVLHEALQDPAADHLETDNVDNSPDAIKKRNKETAAAAELGEASKKHSRRARWHKPSGTNRLEGR